MTGTTVVQMLPMFLMFLNNITQNIWAVLLLIMYMHILFNTSIKCYVMNRFIWCSILLLFSCWLLFLHCCCRIMVISIASTLSSVHFNVIHLMSEGHILRCQWYIYTEVLAVDFSFYSEVFGTTCNSDNVSSKYEAIPHSVSEQIVYFLQTVER